MNLGKYTQWDTAGGEYYFDQAAADHFVNFFPANLRFIQGPKTGEPIILEPWLKYHFSQIFGWKRTSDGLRRCRYVFIFIPRQNSKSTIDAGVSLYMLTSDKEHRPRIYSLGSEMEEALVVYNYARDMVKQSPTLPQVLEIKQYEIVCPRNNGIYKALSGKPKHGLSPSCNIFDELHQYPNSELWDAMRTGQASRPKRLTIASTTAGEDQSTICFEQYLRALRAIADPKSDPTLYAIIYEAEKDDDWQDPGVWAKANPNLGVSVQLDYLRDACREAIADKAKVNTFLRLHLNLWTTSGEKWIPMHHWDANQRVINWDDYRGQPCWIGLDFSKTTDITACVQIFHSLTEPGALVVKPTFWIPDEPISKRTAQDQRQVRNWAEQGLIRKIPGSMIDHDRMIADLREIGESCFVKCVGFDPAYAYRVIPTLVQDGWEIKPFKQSSINFGLPCELMKGLIASQKLHHDGNPVLRWMADNAVDRTDASGNERPDKGKSSDKIDGIVAMLMAIAIAEEPGDGDIIAEPGANRW